MDERPSVRGIFAFEDEETLEWRRVVLTDGSGGLPKFATKSECEDFVRRHCWRGSNPDYPTLQHVFTTLVDWKQIEEVLLPKINEYDQRHPPEAPGSINTHNRFLYDHGAKLTAGVDARLNLPFHHQTNRESTMNTIKYMFHHTRSGIFVMIRRRRVVVFAPFVNREYENTWGEQLQLDSSDGSVQQYHREKQRHHGREEYETDARKWWNDGSAIHMDDLRGPRGRDAAGKNPQYWDDYHLTQLRDLLEDACQHRSIPDCEFFINKQQHPHLKDNASEPFGFLFNKDDNDENEDMPRQQHVYSTYAPILSFHSSKRYADVPIPSSVDWETATGLLFPQSFMHSHCDQCQCGDSINCENQWECYCDTNDHGVKPHGIEAVRDLFSAGNRLKSTRAWDEKVPTAFFRGSASGASIDAKSNQRLLLSQLSEKWRHDPEYGGDHHNGRFLDAAITTVPSTNIKAAGKPVQFLSTDRGSPSDGPGAFVPLHEQAAYKYIVYVDGACASKRYSYLMRLGSVILKVESTCVAKELWFTSLLRPYEDHVPVKADLSDLAEQIQWCRDNDDQCREIAARAQDLYDQYISKDAIHDYMELVCHRIAERFQPAPQWYHRPKGIDTIKKPMLYRPRSMCVSGNNARHCRRCRELKKEDEARERERRSSRENSGGYDRGRSGNTSSRYSSYGGGNDRDRNGDRRERRYSGDNFRSRDRDDRYGSSSSSRDHYGSRESSSLDDSREASSPKRQKTNVVPQCRRCRRAKSACTCSYRR
ncbi:hypothetical protein Poli38472_006224 [Pythium oligandrum]|uniref:Glycosyl transferase CAP10 domain-containing protein n=1 Tax=Pythium oligandrum TaxID=41045 RepID=A0A8K1CU99_PYTOL|nr:hypothetical protein Poli38472_006224 [Pythium oligandrum]|eukprot:TMW68756.1 hypothetical protein Poli38472_006224 [Pythium oligandrum]